ADVGATTIGATSSSRYMVPLYWPDPKTGIGFQVQVEVPANLLKSEQDLELLQISPAGPDGRPLRLRDIASVRRGRMPGEYDRYNMRRVVSMTANIEGEDLGRVADKVERAVKEAGEPPRGARVEVRGQVTPMQQMFRDLAIGLGLAVAVIFLVLTG